MSTTTRLRVTIDSGTARRLPYVGYAAHSVEKSWHGGIFSTWRAAHSVTAAPHLNAASLSDAEVVWTSEEVTYVDGTRRIATETRTSYFKQDPDPDADGVTLYVRTTITREA